MTGAIILTWFAKDAAKVFDAVERKGLEQAIDAGRKLAAAEPSFWNSVIEPDGMLVQFMAASKHAGHEAEAIAQAYRKAKNQGGSPREVASIVEHLNFVAVMARKSKKPALAKTMERIVKFLNADEGMW